MATRCTSDVSSKLALLGVQVKQYRAMLDATEKAAERRLFAAHIYEEDKAVIQGKIVKKLLDMKVILKQCQHH